jgi:geranylgeranylglycerol-phosphate geranylgeranyltransferase
MNIFKNLCIFLNITNIVSFYRPITLINLSRATNHQNKLYLFNKQNIIKHTNKTIEYTDIQKNNNKINNKWNGFLHIIRANNIIPTFFLCLSGGWIINPSIHNLFHSTSFIISTINTILIMSSSMIINDLYDINIDKINNPNRPLVTGVVSKTEAIMYAVSLLSTTEYLNIVYLPQSFQWIIHLAILNIILYTPIFKKLLIIKNISCASLIAFSIFLSGLTSTKELMEINNNFDLLSITISFIFFGSLSNEILLDIQDVDGDNKNNIKTIPSVFGNKFAWHISSLIICFNIISNSLSLNYIYNRQFAVIIAIIFMPLLINLYKIKYDNYSKKSIENYMKNSNNTLFTLLIFLCILASNL